MPQSAIIDEIFDAFQRRGQKTYGERVSMSEHMLQSAYFAEQAGAKPTLIASALLHDIGHLIHDMGEGIADHGIDAIHEEVGAEYLEKYFVPAVSEPARLHVAAKRYLCAVDPQYFAELSAASVQSLALQGGPFSAEEVQAFEQSPFFEDAIQLRRFDELGKVPQMTTPELEHYRSFLEMGLRE